jgi:hypothetical protein
VEKFLYEIWGGLINTRKVFTGCYMEIKKDFVDEEVFIDCVLSPKDLAIIAQGDGRIGKIKIMGRLHHIAIRLQEEDE